MTSKQTPITSPFGAHSTANEVMHGIDLSDRTAVVTGGYSGIGLIMARTLAKSGARVIVPARDRAKAIAALEDADGVEVMEMDLIDHQSVDAFAQQFLACNPALDILINGAGVMACALFRDEDGHEGQFATNHLGHYRLTCLLWPSLAKAGARVVTLSSRGHQISPVEFDDVDFKGRDYDKWVAYGQSKTANALFAVQLDRLGAPHGVRAFSVHPGQILTGLARHLSAEELADFDVYDAEGKPKVDPEAGLKNPEQGAATALWCATSPLLADIGGVYCEDCNVAAMHTGEMGRAGVAPWAVDKKAAQRLWSMTEQWTGLSI